MVGGVEAEPQSDLGGCGGRVDRPQGSAAAVEDAYTHTHTHKPSFPHSLCSLSSSTHYLFSPCVPFVYIIITSLSPRTPPLLVARKGRILVVVKGV